MYRRLSSVLFPIVLLALIGAVIWGYQEIHTKNLLAIKAENQYQRAFHNLSYHVNQLHEELGSTLAINSSVGHSYQKNLVHIWQISNQAQGEINQLPLALLPFSQTEQLLNHISQFSFRTAVRNLKTKPITKDEMALLNNLYKQSKTISDKLNNVQTQVLAKNLRWMDVEVALASHKMHSNNEIIDGFRTVDKTVGDGKAVNWGTDMAHMTASKNFKALSGQNQTMAQIKQKAVHFPPMKGLTGMKVMENGKGTSHFFYSIKAKLPNYKEEVHLNMSKQGGLILNYINPVTVTDKLVDLSAAEQAATEFLNKQGYKQMKAVSYDEYQNIAVMNFVKVQNNVLIYPEKLTVSVALDNADIIGFQAVPYVYAKKDWPTTKPLLSIDQAEQYLGSQFIIKNIQLAYINNESSEDVFCYQFTGVSNGRDYKIFINALNGDEESTQLLRPQELNL